MRPGVYLLPRNKATDFWMGWWDIPSAEETEIPKVPHRDHIDNFFRLSRLSAQIIRTRGRNIQRVRPAAFCSWDSFLLHDNAPAHKAASICKFLTHKKCYNPLSPSVLSRFISSRLVSVPQSEKEVKRSPLRILLRSKKP